MELLNNVNNIINIVDIIIKLYLIDIIDDSSFIFELYLIPYANEIKNDNTINVVNIEINILDFLYIINI